MNHMYNNYSLSTNTHRRDTYATYVCDKEFKGIQANIEWINSYAYEHELNLKMTTQTIIYFLTNNI